MFEWTRFFDQNQIEYATSGPNVSRDHVAIRCPFCGSDDRSQHLSVNLSGKGWRCFRRPDHRGRSPVKLVRALLNCSYEAAQRIVGEAIFLPSDFAARVGDMMATKVATPPRSLALPDEFKTLRELPSARPFIQYLEGRGFTRSQIMRDMRAQFDLRYCTRGPYSGRIVFPVTCDDELVSWTGRSIRRTATLRYKSLSNDEETAGDEGFSPALGPISDYLLWSDQLQDADADTIYLCEGPFDALKVWLLGEREGIVGTCFFTSSPSSAQVSMLHQILPRFKRRRLLLDANTLSTTLRILWNALPSLSVKGSYLPRGVKDPGELTRDQLLTISD